MTESRSKKSDSRDKDAPTYFQMLGRLEKEAGRLISDLVFCRVFIEIDPFRDAEAAKSDPIAISASALFHSCEECLFIGTMRLWENKAKYPISFQNFANSMHDTFRYKEGQRAADFYEWKRRVSEVESSLVLESLKVIRDEWIGHNLIDSGSRIAISRLAFLGEPGEREFGAENGQLLYICEKTVELLFDLISLSGRGRTSVLGEDFKGAYEEAKRVHVALLNKLFR